MWGYANTVIYFRDAKNFFSYLSGKCHCLWSSTPWFESWLSRWEIIFSLNYLKISDFIIQEYHVLEVWSCILTQVWLFGPTLSLPGLGSPRSPSTSCFPLCKWLSSLQAKLDESIWCCTTERWSRGAPTADHIHMSSRVRVQRLRVSCKLSLILYGDFNAEYSEHLVGNGRYFGYPCKTVHLPLIDTPPWLPWWGEIFFGSSRISLLTPATGVAFS
jgi:hypothetical protein